MSIILYPVKVTSLFTAEQTKSKYKFLSCYKNLVNAIKFQWRDKANYMHNLPTCFASNITKTVRS